MISCENLKPEKTFSCTGSDESKTWGKLHNLPKEMDCDYCAGEATKFFNGLHDLVNMGLGKQPEKVNDFHYLSKKIDIVKKACKVDGRC